MTITQFNKSNIRALRVELNEAMKSLSDKYGVKVHAGNASFSTNEVTFKLTLNVLNENGLALTQNAEYFELVKEGYGLGHFSIGDSVRLGSDTYVLSGFNNRASKNQIEISDLKNNKTYGCTVAAILLQNPS
tara:strand:- start:279 stop:674 length:396 start_codon:yes stop_codon:yes gene_type:complete